MISLSVLVHVIGMSHCIAFCYNITLTGEVDLRYIIVVKHGCILFNFGVVGQASRTHRSIYFTSNRVDYKQIILTETHVS